MIEAKFICYVPCVEIDGVSAVVVRRGKLASIPQRQSYIKTGSDANPLAEEEPGVRVTGVVYDVNDGTVEVYCVHSHGDLVSALDLICIDGWECEGGKDEEAAYRDACKPAAEDRQP